MEFRYAQFLHTAAIQWQWPADISRNLAMQAIDQVINSGGKTHYMSGGTQPCNVTFRGPNGFAAGVAAQHSQDYSVRLEAVH